MVSFWPWKGDDSSPASFEKTLSTLAAKITTSQQHLDILRQRSRRLKVLWTLYTSFAYLLCFIILALVVGWKNWNATEYTAALGSPLVIYLVRELISTYYNYRIDSASSRLQEHQRERAKTIDRLKDATKYNSTQQLLEKYGEGQAPKKPQSPKPQKKTKQQQPKSQPQRTGIAPPPTANIQRSPSASKPSTPVPSSEIFQRPSSAFQPEPPSFAPNAFAQTVESEHWYDRILDVLLGEDETSPKNRIVLICPQCKLVNGQAPPGVKSLTELGRWRCMGCGAMNGEEDEVVRIVKELKEKEIDIDSDQAPDSPGAAKDDTSEKSDKSD